MFSAGCSVIRSVNPPLFFLSRLSTFVCPTEIISFSDKASEFHDVNCEVVGVSVDSHFTHLAWINTPRKVPIDLRVAAVAESVILAHSFSHYFSGVLSDWRFGQHPHPPAVRPQQTDLQRLRRAAGGSRHRTEVGPSPALYCRKSQAPIYLISSYLIYLLSTFYECVYYCVYYYIVTCTVAMLHLIFC